jgi:hypothetical protein
MVVLLPSDEVWHRLYGLDITAWSPPHLLAAVNFSLVLLAAATAQVSLLPRAGWRKLEHLSGREVLALIALGLGTLQLLQIGTTEWDGQDVLARTAGPGFAAAFAGRPDWVYPVVVVSIALFLGQLSIHALRRAGVATLLALGVLAFRLAALAVLDAWQPAIGMAFVSHALLLAPLFFLDVWYGRRLDRPDSTSTVVGGSALAGAVCLLFTLPTIALTMTSPPLTISTAPGMIVVGLVMAIGAGMAGAGLGNWLGSLRQDMVILRRDPSVATAPSG